MAPHSLFSALIELIYPARCVYCGRIGSHFCRRCRAQARAVGESICVRCGQPTTERCTCHACRRTPPDPLHGMRGVVFYHGPITFAIHAFKYRGMTQLARPLAAYLISYLDAHPLTFDALVPVPLHPERFTFRGYNQSRLLAEEVSRERGVPVRCDLIQRVRHTSPQVHLKRRERLQNMNNAFAPLQADRLHGERLLLIDDVCTTGATLRACAVALEQAGANDIWALTLARAQPPLALSESEEDLTPADAFLAWDAKRWRQT